MSFTIAPREDDPVTALKRLVIAWDSHDSIEFLAALRAARRMVGFMLADATDDADEADVLDEANGYGAGV